MRIYLLLFILFFSFGGCEPEIIVHQDEETPHMALIYLDLSYQHLTEIEASRSKKQNTVQLMDVNILVFENDLLLPFESEYYFKVLSSERLEKNISSGEKRIVLVCNTGINITSLITTYQELLQFKFKQETGQVNELIGESGIINIVDKAVYSIQVKHLKSRITVAINRDELDPAVTITPLKIALRNVSQTSTYSEGNFINNYNDISVYGGDSVVANTLQSIDFSDHHNLSQMPSLYLYENRQPDGYFDTALATKAPKGTPPNNLIAISANKTCSYLEVYASYSDTSDGTNGFITYRFFIGKDVNQSFDVERNFHYKITLLLKGKARKSGWKVVTNMDGEFYAEDLYLGYKIGSTNQATIRTNNKQKSSINWEITDITDNGFLKIPTLQGSINDNILYIPIEAYTTNVLSDTERIATFTVKLTTLDGTSSNIDIRVIQTHRLTYPVGVILSDKNNQQTHIQVKKHDPELSQATGKYSLNQLNSYGPWTAIVEAGDWFRISSQPNGAGSSKINHLAGEVSFYLHSTQNTLPNQNRYGVIHITYHNNKCSHRIYVRQGFEDQQLSLNGAYWSAFNALGTTDEGETLNLAPQTSYPTHTGWLFKQGNNIALHPYIPGFQELAKKIELSTGSEKNWQYVSMQHYWSLGKQGPCRAGYTLPNANNFNEISYKKNNKSQGIKELAGFVIDDYVEDANTKHLVSGIYSDLSGTDGATLGTLFIQTEVESLKNAFVFFPFGRGGRGVRNGNKPNLGMLDYENTIGTLNQTYGAGYWSNENVLLNIWSGEDLSRVENIYDNKEMNAYFIKCVRR